MSQAVKRRRGTTVQHSTFTGLEGELTVDTDKETVVVHDGATAGGFPLQREDNTAAGKLFTAISPAQLTANTNDWAPTGHGASSMWRVSTDASRNLTGIASNFAGRILTLHNVGAFALVLKDEDANSTAANRFALTADVTLSADSVAVLQYDSTTQRWRVVSGGGGSGAVIPTGTGFTHITAGVQDGAAKLVENVDVHASAGIALSKLESIASMRIVGNSTGGAAVPALITFDNDAGLTANSATIVPTQQAVKSYVDAVAQGLSPKSSVRVATAVAGTLATSFENGDTIDGVVLATGNRILIKNQSAGAENGVYVVNASGAPTRAVDFDSNAEVEAGAFIFVEEGTANSDSGWVLTTDGTIVLGTTALAFTQFSGAGQIVAGFGILKSGNTLSVDQAMTPTWTGAHIFQSSSGVSLQAWGAGAGETTALRLYDLSTNYIAIRAVDGLGASYTITLPSAVGGAGVLLQDDGTGKWSWDTFSHGLLTDRTGDAHADLLFKVPVADARNVIAPTTDIIPLATKASASQTKDLLQMQSSAGTPLSVFDAAGRGFTKTLTWALAIGTPATTGTNKTNVLIVPRAGKIVKAWIVAKTGPTGADLIVDINLGGTSIWNATQANRVKITAGGTSGSQTSFDTTTVAEGDQITIDVDQIGSTIAGQDVTVQLLLLLRNT